MKATEANCTNCAHIQFGLWVTEASSLLIPPGPMPATIETTLGNLRDFRMIDVSPDWTTYRQELGVTTLRVFNT